MVPGLFARPVLLWMDKFLHQFAWPQHRSCPKTQGMVPAVQLTLQMAQNMLQVLRRTVPLKYLTYSNIISESSGSVSEGKRGTSNMRAFRWVSARNDPKRYLQSKDSHEQNPTCALSSLREVDVISRNPMIVSPPSLTMPAANSSPSASC